MNPLEAISSRRCADLLVACTAGDFEEAERVVSTHPHQARVTNAMGKYPYEVAAANGVPVSVCQMLSDAIEDGGLADRPAQVPANLLMNMDETTL